LFSEQRKSKYSIGCVVLVLVLCLASGTVFARYQKTTSCYDGRTPLKSYEVLIDVSQQQLLIEQFRKFADEHGFEFDLAYFTPDHKSFRIDLLRKDTEVILTNPFQLEEFRIGFYNYDCIHPTVASDIDGLVRDFESYILEIPDAKLSVRP
jgi:hypothetical protein